MTTLRNSSRSGDAGDPYLYEPFVPGQEDEDFRAVVARERRAEALHDAIDLLPDRQAEYIRLSMGGLSVVEIAAKLGVSQPAVSQGLARARESLAVELAYLY